MLYLNDHLQDLDLDDALSQLSDQRREQALRYKHDLGQRTCAAAYLLLCQGLRSEYGITEKPIFAYGEHGKPFIFGPNIQRFISTSATAAKLSCVSSATVLWASMWNLSARSATL